MHTKGLLALGLVADVERDVPGRSAHLFQKLASESRDQGIVSRTKIPPLESDELPVKNALFMTATRRLPANISIPTHKARLIVINISGRMLSLPSENGPKSWPPYVEISGIRVHLITVRALPTVSASKQGKATPVTVIYDDLVNPDVLDETPA